MLKKIPSLKGNQIKTKNHIRAISSIIHHIRISFGDTGLISIWMREGWLPFRGQLGLHSGMPSTLDLIHMTQKKWKSACRVRVAEVTLGLSVLDEMPTLDLKKSHSRKHAHTPEKFLHTPWNHNQAERTEDDCSAVTAIVDASHRLQHTQCLVCWNNS